MHLAWLILHCFGSIQHFFIVKKNLWWHKSLIPNRSIRLVTNKMLNKHFRHHFFLLLFERKVLTQSPLNTHTRNMINLIETGSRIEPLFRHVVAPFFWPRQQEQNPLESDGGHVCSDVFLLLCSNKSGNSDRTKNRLLASPKIE